jgi:hypothetical protein
MKRSFNITVTIETTRHDKTDPTNTELLALQPERVENAANGYLHYMGRELLETHNIITTVSTTD